MQAFRPFSAAAVATLLLAMPCTAFAGPHPLQPFVTFDTTGIGAGASYPLSRTDDLRLQATSIGIPLGTHPDTYTVTGANGANPVVLNLSLKKSAGAGGINFTFDHHLKADKPLFVSAGFMYSAVRADADTVSKDSTVVLPGLVIGGGAFGTLGIHARWPRFSPYLGFGWLHRNAAGGQKGAAIEAGAFYIGKPTITYSTEGAIAANPAIVNPYLDSLAQKLKGDLGGLPIYPVVRVRIPVGGPR